MFFFWYYFRTGWTGVHLLEHFAKNYPLNVAHPFVTWAVVARNEDKLEKAIDQVTQSLNTDWLHSVKRFIVDNNDLEEVEKIVPLASCIATVVGPYAKYGENLIRVCAETGTHYCDITGENVWVKQMIDKYHKVAKDSGALIIPFCGNDCIPSDINAYTAVKALDFKAIELYDVFRDHLERKFELEGFLINMSENNRHKNGPSGGGGTVETIVTSFGEQETRTEMYNYNLLSLDDKVNTVDKGSKPQLGVGRNSKIKKWTTHYPMAAINSNVVRRSRFLLPQIYGDSVSYKEAWGLNYVVNAIGVSAFFAVGYAAIKSSFVRRQFLKLSPSASSFPNPLPKNDYKPGKFEFVTLAKGFYKINSNIKTLECRVSFKCPDEIAWTYTAILLGECAVCLAKSAPQIKDFSSHNGGILTTACLGEILIGRLKNQNVDITVSFE